MKLIGLDVGTKRIGVAKADSKVRIAVPYTAVEVNNGQEFDKIASLARAWDIEGFVLGLPRNNEGRETKQSAYVRKFAKELKEHIPGIKICFQDESLTSVEAEKRLKNRKKGYKKGDIDSEAAVIILQDFLEEKIGKPTTKAAAVHRKSKSVRGHKPHRLRTALISLLVLFILLAGGAAAYYFYNIRPVSEVDCATDESDACSPVDFSVETGSSLADVANELKEIGLIRDSLVFQIYFRLNAGDGSLRAGEYQLNSAMSNAEITELFLKGGDGVYSYTVLPGQRVREIRDDLIDLGYSAEAVDAALVNHYRNEEFGWIFEGMPEDATSLEGYLYGDTYEFFKDDSAEAVVKRLLSEFADVAKENQLKEKFAEHGLNMYQGVTLASVVQREANNAADMAKVAQVFYNRLAQNISLGSDVTAQYAADLVDPERTTYTDNASVVEIDSPYNTRKYPGLPYGPVSNPGLDALLAVATPDTSMSDMLFFLTGDDGMMYYSSTEEGHNQNRTQYCQTLCNVGL